MPPYTRKPKQGKAPWTRLYPEQLKKLHPERSPANNLRSRSATEAQRMAVYNPIKDLFLEVNHFCESCAKAFGKLGVATQVHHKCGRDGLLLFDVRHFLPVCDACHRWIDANRDAARKLGLLAPKGKWNTME